MDVSTEYDWPYFNIWNPANFSNHPFSWVFGRWKFQKGGGLRNRVVPGALRSEALKREARMIQCICLLWPNGPGIGLGHRVQGSNPANFSNHPFFGVFGGWKFQKGGGLRNRVVPGALGSEVLKREAHMTQCIWLLWPNGPGIGLGHRVQGPNPANFSNHPFFGVFGGWKFQKRGGLRNPPTPSFSNHPFFGVFRPRKLQKRGGLRNWPSTLLLFSTWFLMHCFWK